MATLEEYYNKYHGAGEFTFLVQKWRNIELYPTTVKAGGNEYEMTLTRWIKRLEKSAKSKINIARREKRRDSLEANEGKYYHTQPSMKTVPLHQDLGFLKMLLHFANQEERWSSNQDDTVRTLDKDTRAWYKTELQQLITLETIRSTG